MLDKSGNVILNWQFFKDKMFDFLLKLKRLLLSFNLKVILIVEEGNWVIYWISSEIINNLKKLKLIKADIGYSFLAKKKIIHFGSINCLIKSNKIIKLRKSNKHVLTWFHIVPSDKRLKFIPYLNKKIDILHTSSFITKNKLIEAGFNKDKIEVVPLGVDLSIFKSYNKKRKSQLRKKFNLPKDKIIIGSFQKDGVGWGEGLEPKLIKGPDIFCEVVKKIKKKFDIHIFLTGPARGYVKKKLEKYKIPYTHIYLENYKEMADCYNVLDLYIIASRVEGGPLSLLECMATGIPIVTTKVGMALYLIENEINGFMSDIDDIDQLFLNSIKILKNFDLRKKIINNGFKTIKKYSWQNVAKQYYFKIYKKLLE